MKHSVFAVAAIASLAAMAFAQEPEEDAAASEEEVAEEQAASEESLDESAIESGVVDAQADTTSGGDIFLPSEEIKADTEISFPSDI